MARYTLHLALLVLLFSSYCEGFNAIFNNPVQDLVSKFAAETKIRGPKAPAKLDPQTVLNEIGLQASTEPRPAYARAEQIPTLLSASIAPILRAGSGIFNSNYRIGLEPKDKSRYSYFSIGNKQLSESGFYKGPSQPLVLYELEANAECKLVREACSMLSLTVTVLPTPKKGPNYRAEASVRFKGFGKNYPFMYDPNSKVKIAGADDIITYLFQNYGKGGVVPWTLNMEKAWPKITAALGVQVARLGAGGTYRDSNFKSRNSKPLTLWAYEGSPFCKIVRERLTCLEIPHTIIFSPRGSLNRQQLYEKTGRFQVPYLEDPNTGVDLFESEAIVEYLEKYYGLSTPVKYL